MEDQGSLHIREEWWFDVDGNGECIVGAQIKSNWCIVAAIEQKTPNQFSHRRNVPMKQGGTMKVGTFTAYDELLLSRQDVMERQNEEGICSMCKVHSRGFVKCQASTEMLIVFLVLTS